MTTDRRCRIFQYFKIDVLANFCRRRLHYDSPNKLFGGPSRPRRRENDGTDYDGTMFVDRSETLWIRIGSVKQIATWQETSRSP